MEWHTVWHAKTNVWNTSSWMNERECMCAVADRCIREMGWLFATLNDCHKHMHIYAVYERVCAINFLICVQNFIRKMSFKKLRPFNFFHILLEMNEAQNKRTTTPTLKHTACVGLQVWCLKTSALPICVRACGANVDGIQSTLACTHALPFNDNNNHDNMMWANKFSHLNSNTPLYDYYLSTFSFNFSCQLFQLLLSLFFFLSEVEISCDWVQNVPFASKSEFFRKNANSICLAKLYFIFEL